MRRTLPLYVCLVGGCGEESSPSVEATSEPGFSIVVPRSAAIVVGEQISFEVLAFDAAGNAVEATSALRLVLEAGTQAELSTTTIRAISIDHEVGVARLVIEDSFGEREVATINIVGTGSPVPDTRVADAVLLPGFATVPIGQPVRLSLKAFNAAGAPVQTTATFASDQPSIATVDPEGQMSTLTEGPVTISATIERADAPPLVATAIFHVGPDPTAPAPVSDLCSAIGHRSRNCRFDFGDGRMLLHAGAAPFQARATVFATCPSEVSTSSIGRWTSDNPAVAAVGDSGSVQGLTCGAARITYEPTGEPDDIFSSCYFDVVVEPEWHGAWHGKELGFATCEHTASVELRKTREAPYFAPYFSPAFIVDGIETNFPPGVTLIESVAQHATKPSYMESGDTHTCSCFNACCTQAITNIWLFGASTCDADHVEEDTGFVKYVWDRGGASVCE